jgi:hypothetical protein
MLQQSVGALTNQLSAGDDLMPRRQVGFTTQRKNGRSAGLIPQESEE